MGLEQFDFRLAYDFCADVQNAVFTTEDDPDAPGWFLPHDDDVFLDKACVPRKSTLLHEYIYNCVTNGTEYALDKGAPDTWIPDFRPLLLATGQSLPAWFSEEDVWDHRDQLETLLNAAVLEIVPAAFHLLFSDMRLLQAFQRAVARRVRTFDPEDYPGHLAAKGVLRRRAAWPTWLSTAVFHRDKGRCQGCQVDLSGVLLLEGRIHIDHIMPLAKGGSNDPTNLQVLCRKCNLKKGQKDEDGQWHTQTYWQV